MKRFLLFMLLWNIQFCFAQDQYILTGYIYSSQGQKPLLAASLGLKQNGSTATTNSEGYFSIALSTAPDTLIVTHVGYITQYLPVASPGNKPFFIFLQPDIEQLKEVVVSTGYYEIPRERATGSFIHLDNELLNRSVSTDIISRLEGVTNGLQFDRSRLYSENPSGTSLRVRGLSTINSDDSPLIVVDNFPFEGELNDINPNDVESVTILRDAAASSIWGARAGNGVIVITTKQGKYNQPARISFNSNVNITERPDLYYNRSFITSKEWMEIEKELFEKGFYSEEEPTNIPPYVELLIKKRDGLVSDNVFNSQVAIWQQQDLRDDAYKYLYRNSVDQQYALSISGGAKNYNYYLSGGYDKNLDRVVGNDYSRVSLHSKSALKPLENLSVSTSLYYTESRINNNGLTLFDISPENLGIIPYMQLADPEGNALPVLHNHRMRLVESAADSGLLDWNYRPLEEIRLADNSFKRTMVRFDGGLKYSTSFGLNIELKYQYQRYAVERRNHHAVESYYVRDFVNRFTQPDGSQVIPHGSILEGGNSSQTAHSGRVQLNYERSFGDKHWLKALVGTEIRQDISRNSPGYLIYDYNDEVLTGNAMFDYTEFYPTRPASFSRIPAPPTGQSHITDRFLSYYGNAAYTYDERLTVSMSSRWDGSNLFGVKTNQKGVPLWSLGGSWELSRESFWNEGLLNYFRLRVTWGTNGNVNKTVSAYPTVSYNTDFTSGLQEATIRSAGNPSLRWEKVSTINIGADFRLGNNFLRGSLEYYSKKGTDLIGTNYIDPTTGISRLLGRFEINNSINYADIDTKGIDLELQSQNIRGNFNWQTILLLSRVENKVTDYMAEEAPSIYSFTGSNSAPVVGNSNDAVYALPWAGLNHETGMPQVMLDGNLSSDYTTYVSNLSPEDLVVSGVSVPTYHGSLRNVFNWKALSLSANITWKAGYVLRRSSINYNSLYNQGIGHMDYLNRWQKTGDESYTSVPARPDDVDNNRDYVYTDSEALIEKGDHIRLQDIQLSYRLDNRLIPKLPVDHVRIYLYANNIGILWRATKSGLDPDYPNATYPASRSLALGLQFVL